MLAPLLALGAFLLGAAAGGVLAARFAARHPQHMARTLAIEVALLLAACAWCAAVEIREDDVSAYVAIVLLALAMGVRNATVRKLAVPDLTTTVLSLTLTGLAAESPPAGGTGRGSARRIAAVGAMLLGALAGRADAEGRHRPPARRRRAAGARDVAGLRARRAAGGGVMADAEAEILDLDGGEVRVTSPDKLFSPSGATPRATSSATTCASASR